MVNVPLLRKVVEWVEEQELLSRVNGRSEWRQSYWIIEDDFCGTQACVAGKVILLEGWTPVLRYDRYEDRHIAEYCEKNGVSVDIENLAAEILDLEEEDAERLFAGSNATAAEIRQIAENIAGEPL